MHTRGLASAGGSYACVMSLGLSAVGAQRANRVHVAVRCDACPRFTFVVLSDRRRRRLSVVCYECGLCLGAIRCGLCHVCGFVLDVAPLLPHGRLCFAVALLSPHKPACRCDARQLSHGWRRAISSSLALLGAMHVGTFWVAIRRTGLSGPLATLTACMSPVAVRCWLAEGRVLASLVLHSRHRGPSLHDMLAFCFPGGYQCLPPSAYLHVLCRRAMLVRCWMKVLVQFSYSSFYLLCLFQCVVYLWSFLGLSAVVHLAIIAVALCAPVRCHVVWLRVGCWPCWCCAAVAVVSHPCALGVCAVSRGPRWVPCSSACRAR